MSDNPSGEQTERQAEPSFEQGLARLEQIVEELEQGEIPLERALELYEQGSLLNRRLTQALDAAERRIELLRRDGGREPFEPGDAEA